MIQHIKERKIVVLQDVAADFKLHVQVTGVVPACSCVGRAQA